MPAMSTPKNIDISLLRLKDAHQFLAAAGGLCAVAQARRAAPAG
jgi:hypothetical protein